MTLCEFDFKQVTNIDSTNMRSSKLAPDDVIESYDAYDGFIILHGTDIPGQLSSFFRCPPTLIQNKRETHCALTGSQQPMANPFTDAKLNSTSEAATKRTKTRFRA